MIIDNTVKSNKSTLDLIQELLPIKIGSTIKYCWSTSSYATKNPHVIVRMNDIGFVVDDDPNSLIFWNDISFIDLC
jgi:hypothetical protein